MDKKATITKEVTIVNGQVSVNGEVVFERNTHTEVKDFLRACYQQLGIDYPKFFKMDLLCQLGFIGSEILLKDTEVLTQYDRHRLGIVLSNSSASLDTDRRYNDTIKDAGAYFPSPAVFVYTLPSIMCGEIAIRNGIQGENHFFVTEAYDAPLLESQISTLFVQGHTDACLGGWVQVEGNNYELVMFWVE